MALWMDQGATLVDRLRPRTVPPGIIYTCACCKLCWSPFKEKELVDKMRAIVAQFEFLYEINEWEEGVFYLKPTFMCQSSIQTQVL